MGLTGCGSGGASAPGTSLVTISMGQNSKTAMLKVERNSLFARMKPLIRRAFDSGTALASIPAEVASVRFTISASDMSAITQEVTNLDPSGINVTFEVPNGTGRLFHVDALNVGKKVIYSSDASADLTGQPVNLTFNMTGVAPLASQIVIGSISDASTNDGVESATVTFTPSGGGTPVTATTSAIGQFFVELPLGDYAVSVVAPGHLSTSSSLTVVALPASATGFQQLNVKVTASSASTP